MCRENLRIIQKTSNLDCAIACLWCCREHFNHPNFSIHPRGMMGIQPHTLLLPRGGASTHRLGSLCVLPHPGKCCRNVRYYGRRKVVKLPPAVRTRMAQRDALRTRLLAQYEEERRPRFVRKAIHFRSTNTDARDQDSRHLREDDVHCGIFWDIENVRHEHVSIYLCC